MLYTQVGIFFAFSCHEVETWCESELWTRLTWILWGCFLGMRPSVWYRIQDDQVMIFKKINEQGNHLVPCAWSWMNLVMRWGRNVIMTICSIGYYRMMLRVLGVSMLIANSSLLKGDRQPATPKAIFHSQVSLPLFRHTAYVHVDRKPCVSPLEHEIEGFFFTATKVI